MFLLGHSFFEGAGVHKDLDEAAWWYSRASAKGSAMGSAYVGVMYHFGLGLEKNTVRAARYYNDALEKGKGEESSPQTGAVVMPMQISLMLQTLIWMTSLSSYQMFSPLTLSVEYVVQMMWSK